MPNHPLHHIRARFATLGGSAGRKICNNRSELRKRVNGNAADNSAEAQGIQLCRSKGESNVQVFVNLIRPEHTKVGAVEAKKAKRRIMRGVIQKLYANQLPR